MTRKKNERRLDAMEDPARRTQERERALAVERFHEERQREHEELKTRRPEVARQDEKMGAAIRAYAKEACTDGEIAETQKTLSWPDHLVHDPEFQELLRVRAERGGADDSYDPLFDYTFEQVAELKRSGRYAPDRWPHYNIPEAKPATGYPTEAEVLAAADEGTEAMKRLAGAYDVEDASELAGVADYLRRA